MKWLFEQISTPKLNFDDFNNLILLKRFSLVNYLIFRHKKRF